MPYALHTIEVPDGCILNNFDRVIIGGQIGIANAAGGSAGAAVTTAVSFPAQLGGLPPNYAVLVTPSQAAMVSVSSKTANGFNVTLTPLSSATLAAGVFDLIIVG